MDFLEKAFGIGARRWSLRRRRQREEKEARAEDCFETLSLLARASARGAELELLLTEDESARIQGKALFLPRALRLFPDADANRFALVRLALLGGATMALQRDPAAAASPEALLEQDFPAYAAWRDGGIPRLGEEAGPAFFSVRAEAGAPELERRYDPSAGARKPASGQERRAGSAEAREEVDLDSQRARNNPVSHSFEKLETAEEYQGGHRVQDGSNQLEEHAAALEELQLRHVTRSGETAASLYRAEGDVLLSSRDTALAPAAGPQFLVYPEWDYATRTLKPEHCRLYEEDAPGTDPELGWKAKLEESHAMAVSVWRGRFSGVRNQRRWQARQWDGEHLAIDQYVRYRCDLRHGGRGDPRVFASRRPALRDLATFVLVDQSYSTDAYVQGRRVLDVERDAVGLAGLLLEDQAPHFAVAGTWSETRSHCHFLWHKRFDEPWNRYYERAADLGASGYTRLGPAIRHASRQLLARDSRSRLLVLFTDGKPTDFDRYEGRYGIEDIRHAIQEAEQRGISVKALAVESDARRYFPALFGARNYRILHQPEQLPEELFRLFLEACKIA